MSYYYECPECGRHNDPGEKCDCQKEEACTGGTAQTSVDMSPKYIYNNNSTESEVCQDVSL